MKASFVTVILAAILSAISCKGTSTSDRQKEFQRVRSGSVDVVLLSADGTLTHGKDAITIEFRSASAGDLVDVGTVKAGATMPMAGMAPMFGSVFLDRTDTPGRYTADTDLSMAGGWQLKLDWDGPAGRGTATFNAVAD
jgi:hypothetical protein